MLSLMVDCEYWKFLHNMKIAKFEADSFGTRHQIMSSCASFMGHMLIMENFKLHNDKLHTITYRNRECK